MDHLRFQLNRQPDFLLKVLNQVQPVINGGKIVDIIITKPGNGYVSPPNLVITGPGRFAINSIYQ